jgi:hypothetical protein
MSAPGTAIYRRQDPDRARWRTGLGLGALLLLAALSVHCFSPSYSDCAYRCASDEPRCPPGYECRADSFCHKPDASNVCVFGLDLAGVVPDLGSRPDGN